MSNRIVAILLALFAGFIGLQKFYTKKIFAGVLSVIFFWTIIPTILGFLDALKYAMMSDEEFNKRYRMTENATVRPLEYPQQQPQPRPRAKRSYVENQKKPTAAPTAAKSKKKRKNLSELKKKGIEYYKTYQFEEAKKVFIELLKHQPEDYSVLFNLACTEAQMEHIVNAFDYLSQAKAAGLDDMTKINEHKDLAVLRVHPYWNTFVENDYIVDKEDFPLIRESLLDQLKEQKQKRETIIEKVRPIDTQNKDSDNDYSEIFG